MPWRVERWSEVPGLEQSFGDRRGGADASVRTLRQVHGRSVFDAAALDAGEIEGDGLICDQPGRRVGVWTADCVPVHLMAARRKVAAAVHSGWRGTVAGVAEAALDRLREQWAVGPDEIEAALGPAIGGCCYEVGEEVREAFTAAYGADGECGFERRDGRLWLDLRSFLAARLTALGVAHVERVGPCTACRTDLLFSHRREGKTGRQLSSIGWST